MSIPFSARSVSHTEFARKLDKLNDEMTTLLLRDFGLKTLNSDLNVFTYRAKMTPEDTALMKELCRKYGLNVETTFPLWLIDYYRNSILHILENLNNNVTVAYTIYPSNEKEFYDRKHHQWLAIANCFQLCRVMQTAIRVLPVDAEKYMRYVDIIQDEINYLRIWKRDGNKILKAIQAKNANP